MTLRLLSRFQATVEAQSIAMAIGTGQSSSALFLGLQAGGRAAAMRWGERAGGTARTSGQSSGRG